MEVSISQNEFTIRKVVCLHRNTDIIVGKDVATLLPIYYSSGEQLNRRQRNVAGEADISVILDT